MDGVGDRAYQEDEHDAGAYESGRAAVLRKEHQIHTQSITASCQSQLMKKPTAQVRPTGHRAMLKFKFNWFTVKNIPNLKVVFPEGIHHTRTPFSQKAFATQSSSARRHSPHSVVSPERTHHTA